MTSGSPATLQPNNEADTPYQYGSGSKDWDLSTAVRAKV